MLPTHYQLSYLYIYLLLSDDTNLDKANSTADKKVPGNTYTGPENLNTSPLHVWR